MKRGIKRFWCVFCVCKRGKCVEDIQPESRNPRSPFFFFFLFFWSRGCWRHFIALVCFSRQRPYTFKRSQIELILEPLERSWLLVSEKVWNLKIQQSNQKLWLPKVSSASISALSRLSWYLDHFDSNFNPWIVVEMRIW